MGEVARGTVDVESSDWLYPDGHIWANDQTVFCPSVGDWADDAPPEQPFTHNVLCPFCGVELEVLDNNG